MKKTAILIFTTLLITSCYPVKEVISETYNTDNELDFKILKYSEPTNNGEFFVKKNDEKFVNLKIVMTNRSANFKEVSFEKYYIVNDNKDFKAPLRRVVRMVELSGTENKSVKFEGLETKNLSLHFIAPKNEQIKFLIYNDKLVELKFAK